jgi:hypothetical protein
MMMTENISKIDFRKDHEVMDLKPQFLNEPVISMDVCSPSTAPRPSRSGLAPPPLALSSFSSSGVHRVLKSMFAWCHDTRQCQDVTLSNQRHLSEKMGIDEFDEFTLPVPPFDDDPFASLSSVDLRPWRPTTPRVVSARRRRRFASSSSFFFPFWCLHAKEGEESIYLCHFSFYLILACKI